MMAHDPILFRIKRLQPFSEKIEKRVGGASRDRTDE